MFQIGDHSKPAQPEKKPKAARKPAMVSVTVRLEPRHKEKLELLGGEAWLRDQIEAAKPEAVFGTE